MSGYAMSPDLARIISDLSTRLGNLERTRTIPTGTDAPTTSPADGAQYGDTDAFVYYLRMAGLWKSVQMGVRTVYGIIDATSGTPVIVGGTGFTVSDDGVGLYTITFTTPFADVPAVTVTGQRGAGGLNAVNAKLNQATGVTVSAAPIVAYRTDTGAVVDSSFHFQAIGPA